MKRTCRFILILSVIVISPDFFSQETRSSYTSSADYDYSGVRDTVYTLMPYFIEIDLSAQKGYLYSRTEPVKEFGLSSGTKRLEEGVDTKPGLYVIQAKLEKWYSRQFDSTLMLNWMGFNWGIGFHALQGRGYYKYLGKKKSSHGCVRITREMAQELYSKIEEGTPVLVHEGHSAVKIKFGNPGDSFTYLKYVELSYQLNKEYNEMYAGKYFLSYNPKLLIDFNNVYHDGLPIGDSRKITKHQITLPVSEYIHSSTPQPHSFITFEKPLWNFELTMEVKKPKIDTGIQK